MDSRPAGRSGRRESCRPIYLCHAGRCLRHGLWQSVVSQKCTSPTCPVVESAPWSSWESAYLRRQGGGQRGHLRVALASCASPANHLPLALPDP